VHESFRELVHAAGVVHVRVGRDRREGLFEEIGGSAREARDSEPGVDQQVAVAAAYSLAPALWLLLFSAAFGGGQIDSPDARLSNACLRRGSDTWRA
jgi:hypothetical protein